MDNASVPTDSDDTDTGPGRLIGDRYRLASRLGGGAMGTVWSGVDELLRRPVAVKEVALPPGMPEEQAAELRERALREARAIASLSHPNVVTLYDVAREDGEPFVVMELVPSQSLAALLDQHGRLDDQQLAVVADGVAAGLEAAHRAGIVHRDVKPGNVLVGSDGLIKLSDFGISRNIAERTLTSTGILLGTPSFIAPEIVTGDAVTATADMWGLGTTLFAAAEGRTPYDVGDDPLATVTEVARGPVPAASRPGPLGEIIGGLMVKDPANRMPLTEVRRRVQHLLPEPGARPFGLLLDPDAPTVRVRTPESSTPQSSQRSAEPPAPGTGQAAEPAPLAEHPGTPPFALREPVRTRRPSGWSVLGLVLAALLVFAAAAGAGFSATRVLAGERVLPEESSVEPLPDLGLQLRHEAAEHTGDPGSGAFALAVPGDWEKFHNERNDLAGSKEVSWVAPDGSAEISAERFGGFFTAGNEVDDYLSWLPSTAAGSRGGFTKTTDAPTGPDRRLSYQVTEISLVGAPEPAVVRDTSEVLMPRGPDLWVLRASAVADLPTGTSDHLLDAVLPGFAAG
ncbi:serine/threonine protein kinase [Saccharopolyspora sp. HNM0983]|uniref:non-specific serine/threonine protein kinase n=1 Tax=Saccharopolyspora montiporae TaxID=2781240 RepID=A0A929BB77_9PSEU|nr:serine/threonine protein kinase [Saccharopolyspora sp. HNM0983]